MLRIIKKYMGSAPVLQCGLDISQSSIRAVILQHNHYQTKLKAYFIADSLESLRAYLISHFQTDLPNIRVVLAVAEGGLFNQMIESPIALTAEQLDEQVQLILKQHFAVPITDFYYDYQIISSQKLWLTAVAKSHVEDKLAWLSTAGISKIALDVERFALARLSAAPTYAVIRINKFEFQALFIIDKVPLLVRETTANSDLATWLQHNLDQERGLIAKANIQEFYLMGDALNENVVEEFVKLSERFAIRIIPVAPFDQIQVDIEQFPNLNNDKHQLTLAVKLAQWRGHFYDTLQ